LNVFDRISENTLIPDFVKTRAVGAELFHVKRQTDRHDEVGSRFSEFCECAQEYC